MKKMIALAAMVLAISSAAFAQEKMKVPAKVKTALHNKYPDSKNVTWEKEKGNYEANWGGKSGEENSVMFTPAGQFIEMVKAISVNELPSKVPVYVKKHYKGAKIKEAGKVTNAKGELSYEAEVHGRDVIFDEKGNFIKAEK